MNIHRENSDKIFKLTHTDLAGLNLTAIDNTDEFYVKQYWDSTYPFLEIAEIKNVLKKYKNILDVGFGGGFPLLPLALNFPEKKIFGIDSKNKKVEAVRFMADNLNLKNVHLRHLRLEELKIDRATLVTFKAVGKISEYLKIINSDCEVSVCFLKGRNLRELEQVPSELNGFILTSEVDYEITPEIQRKCVIYKRTVPRGTKSRNNLVNLSSFD